MRRFFRNHGPMILKIVGIVLLVAAFITALALNKHELKKEEQETSIVRFFEI